MKLNTALRSICLLIFFCPIISQAQEITLQFANPNLDSNQATLCLDVEAHSNQADVFLDQLNVRFFIDDDQLSLDKLQNPDPTMFLQFGNNTVTGSNQNPFGFNGNFVYVIDNLSRVGNQALELGEGPNNWTYLFEACFDIHPSIDLDNMDEFCPSLVWDLNEANTGGFFDGSEGVQALALNSGGYPSLFLDETVNQFNWDYSASGGTFGGPTTDDCFDVAACVSFDVKVYLEGALVKSNNNPLYNDQMRTDLNDLGLLPGQTYVSPFFGNSYNPAGQPYDGVPWNYNGTEGDAFDSNGNANNADAGYPSNVVDWVLVSLRTNITASSEVFKAACFLLEDGTIQFMDDEYCSLTETSYYIVVEHRNHLLVMTEDPVTVNNGVLAFNFTQNQSYVDIFGIGSGQNYGTTDSGQNVFAMIGGNFNQQIPGASATDVNVNDKVIWQQNNNLFGIYTLGDGNLSGDTNVNDLVVFQKNNNKFSSVPY